MDLEFTPEQELLRTTLRRYLDGAPTADGLADLGILGLLVSPGNGGSGPSMIDAGAASEELGRAAHTSAFLASAVGAATLAEGLGAAELAREIASGGTHATLALYEPGRGYGWDRPATRATGEGVVTGIKTVVLDAVAAERLLVVADPDQGPAGELGVYAVDPTDDRVQIEPADTVDPSRPMGTVHLHGVNATRLGRSGDTAAAVERAVDASALAIALDGLGAASRALELATAYTLERHQFGKPIASFQSVQHLLVDMLTDVELCRAGSYFALWAYDHATDDDRRRAVALAKARASVALPRVGRCAIQVFGGVGFTWEHEIHHLLKRCLSAARLFGDERHHLETIARMVVDQNRAG